MSYIIDDIKVKASKMQRVIVLPESDDIRILKATEIILKEGIAKVILVGNPETIKEVGKGCQIDDAVIIDPSTYDDTEDFIHMFYEMRKEKGITIEEARNLILNDYMYFACMLVKCGKADGVVSGAKHSTSNTLRPALQILKTRSGVKLVSSFFLMIVPDCSYGSNGVFVFSDCGLEQNPDSEKLACIAGESAKSFQMLTSIEPKVAMLSHSTFGSAKHADVDKVVEATYMAKKLFPQYDIDGEMQLDAAIVPDVAKTKAPNSSVAGKANVLVFPDLDAGNIGYKLVQRLAKAEAYGPICQGMAKPVNDLSRGASVDDIVGVVAITALQVL